MSQYERDHEDAASRSVQTVHRLRAEGEKRDGDRQRIAADRPAPRGEDPMMSLKSRPRRRRCKHCRYRFDYRMYTNRCPECGRYRDDYPQPNHGLQAMLFAGAVVGGAAVVLLVVAVLRGL